MGCTFTHFPAALTCKSHTESAGCGDSKSYYSLAHKSVMRRDFKCTAKYACIRNSMIGTQWGCHRDISCEQLSVCLCGFQQPSAQVLLWGFIEYSSCFLLCFHIFLSNPSARQFLPLFATKQFGLIIQILLLNISLLEGICQPLYHFLPSTWMRNTIALISNIYTSSWHIFFSRFTIIPSR